MIIFVPNSARGFTLRGTKFQTVSQSVKEVLQSLVDDNLVQTDKIGSSNCTCLILFVCLHFGFSRASGAYRTYNAPLTPSFTDARSFLELSLSKRCNCEQQQQPLTISSAGAISKNRCKTVLTPREKPEPRANDNWQKYRQLLRPSARRALRPCVLRAFSISAGFSLLPRGAVMTMTGSTRGGTGAPRGHDEGASRAADGARRVWRV